MVTVKLKMIRVKSAIIWHTPSFKYNKKQINCSHRKNNSLNEYDPQAFETHILFI